jgi:hypothetical protein
MESGAGAGRACCAPGGEHEVRCLAGRAAGAFLDIRPNGNLDLNFPCKP